VEDCHPFPRCLKVLLEDKLDEKVCKRDYLGCHLEKEPRSFWKRRESEHPEAREKVVGEHNEQTFGPYCSERIVSAFKFDKASNLRVLITEAVQEVTCLLLGYVFVLLASQVIQHWVNELAPDCLDQ